MVDRFVTHLAALDSKERAILPFFAFSDGKIADPSVQSVAYAGRSVPISVEWRHLSIGLVRSVRFFLCFKWYGPLELDASNRNHQEKSINYERIENMSKIIWQYYHFTFLIPVFHHSSIHRTWRKWTKPFPSLHFILSGRQQPKRKWQPKSRKRTLFSQENSLQIGSGPLNEGKWKSWKDRTDDRIINREYLVPKTLKWCNRRRNKDKMASLISFRSCFISFLLACPDRKEFDTKWKRWRMQW
jgi:hypothetical protein